MLQCEKKRQDERHSPEKSLYLCKHINTRTHKDSQRVLHSPRSCLQRCHVQANVQGVRYGRMSIIFSKLHVIGKCERTSLSIIVTFIISHIFEEHPRRKYVLTRGLLLGHPLRHHDRRCHLWQHCRSLDCHA